MERTTKMTFEQFAEQVQERITAFLPEEFRGEKVFLKPVVKNNGRRLTALIIQGNAGYQKDNIVPLIYLDGFYQDYMSGVSLEDILKNIADVRIGSTQEKVELPSLDSYEQCKHLVLPHLVSFEGNEELLETRVYTRLEDLAVTYHIQLSPIEGNEASISVTNKLMEVWGVSKEQLHEEAVKNIDTLMEPSLEDLATILLHSMPHELIESMGGIENAREQLSESGPMKMYVLRGGANHGASAILSEKVRQKVSSVLGNEVVIIPSSVHELILANDFGGTGIDDIQDMVKEVNSTCVSEEERLSNHVYRFDETKGLVLIQ